ncbi:hypothetical protein RHSIM_RhsimUnG0009900 [Rhododendron simsii]|uniref:Fe2OG dioxygenase domain-containing protein n=1 Tax=Rhododendron simsii TaxID=118357 RepID=A0A834FX62_RHOSS|nr:hypothetical protein RHSIM_RhsimUnG0009900 [Rhododendron simsii]
MPSRVSDAIKPHRHVLDFTSLKELPESHAWSSLDSPSSNNPPTAADSSVSESVPLIDLDDPKAQELVGRACKTWGAFQVKNHGIETSLLDRIESTGKSLFSLPTHQKLKAARAADGVSGYGVARISSFFSKLMWSEGFTILEYDKEMHKLAGRLMGLMLGSLGIAQEDVDWAGPNKEGAAAIQLNSYPACPDPDRAMGLAAHTDSTLLTILYQNNTSGLQVLRDASGWVTVPPVPGALVVNIGDLLHILSNGSYPSVLHRAVVNRTQQRLSVAYLYGPPSNVKISPLSKLLDPTHPPLYRPVTWTEYLGAKAKHFNEALSSVRLCIARTGLVN